MKRTALRKKQHESLVKCGGVSTNILLEMVIQSKTHKVSIGFVAEIPLGR
ncbi:hypothetical protein [Synechococcus sp. M16CYN]